MNNLYGLIINGQIYKLCEGGCLKCAFFRSTVMACAVKEVCTSMFYPNPEKDNCFRFSQELTDEINNK